MQLEKTGELTPTEIQTLAQAGVIPKDTPDEVVKEFMAACQHHGISPFKNEIYLVGCLDKSKIILGFKGILEKLDREDKISVKNNAKKSSHE